MSRSRDTEQLELGALNQESIGLIRIPWPLEPDAAHIKSQLAPRSRELPKSIVNEAPLKALGPLELTGAPDQKLMDL